MTDWETTTNLDNITKWDDTYSRHVDHSYDAACVDGASCLSTGAYYLLFVVCLIVFIYRFVKAIFSLTLIIAFCFRDMCRLTRYRYSRIVEPASLPIVTVSSVDTQPQLAVPTAEYASIGVVPVKRPN